MCCAAEAGVAATRDGLALLSRRGFLLPAAPVLAGTPRAVPAAEGVLMGVGATRLVCTVECCKTLPLPLWAGVSATEATRARFLLAGFEDSIKAMIFS